MKIARGLPVNQGGSITEKCNQKLRMEMTDRRDEIMRLRKDGLTYAEIGHRFGVSKERVRQILKQKPIAQRRELQSKVMFSTSDVSELLSIHPNTVRRWGDKGILKFYRIGPRGDRRYRREDIDSFLLEGEAGDNLRNTSE